MTGIEYVGKLAEEVWCAISLADDGLLPNPDGSDILAEPELVRRIYRPKVHSSCRAYGAYLRGLLIGYAEGAMPTYIRSGQIDMRPAQIKLIEPYIRVWRETLEGGNE